MQNKKIFFFLTSAVVVALAALIYIGPNFISSKRSKTADKRNNLPSLTKHKKSSARSNLKLQTVGEPQAEVFRVQESQNEAANQNGPFKISIDFDRLIKDEEASTKTQATSEFSKTYVKIAHGLSLKRSESSEYHLAFDRSVEEATRLVLRLEKGRAEVESLSLNDREQPLDSDKKTMYEGDWIAFDVHQIKKLDDIRFSAKGLGGRELGKPDTISIYLQKIKGDN